MPVIVTGHHNPALISVARPSAICSQGGERLSHREPKSR